MKAKTLGNIFNFLKPSNRYEYENKTLHPANIPFRKANVYTRI